MQLTMARIHLTLLILLNILSPLAFAEPVTLALGVGVGLTAVGGVFYHNVKCHFVECCDKTKWFPKNITGLKSALNSQLHGQHLVTKSVFDALRSHLSKSYANPPTHPLVMSFHGWTGCGKNFVSKIISEHLFKEGLKSKYVTQFVSTLHFSRCLTGSCPDENKLTEYRHWIQTEVKKKVGECRHALFIFDEMDKMPVGLIDTISAFLDHRDSIDGLDFRFTIFIFLSNSGGNAIAKKAFEFYSNGRSREDLLMRDLDRTIGLTVFNSPDGGLKRSSLIDHNLIDYYVPFLPLERTHVKACIDDYLRDKKILFGKREMDEDGRIIVLPLRKREQTFIEKVLDELEFDSYNLFSLSGCKRISSKIEALLPDVEEHLVGGPWRL